MLACGFYIESWIHVLNGCVSLVLGVSVALGLRKKIGGGLATAVGAAAFIFAGVVGLFFSFVSSL